MESVTFELAAEELDQRFVDSIKKLFKGNKIVITVAPKTKQYASGIGNVADVASESNVAYHIPADVFVNLTDKVFEDETFDIMSEFRKYKVEEK